MWNLVTWPTPSSYRHVVIPLGVHTEAALREISVALEVQIAAGIMVDLAVVVLPCTYDFPALVEPPFETS